MCSDPDRRQGPSGSRRRASGEMPPPPGHPPRARQASLYAACMQTFPQNFMLLASTTTESCMAVGCIESLSLLADSRGDAVYRGDPKCGRGQSAQSAHGTAPPASSLSPSAPSTERTSSHSVVCPFNSKGVPPCAAGSSQCAAALLLLLPGEQESCNWSRRRRHRRRSSTTLSGGTTAIANQSLGSKAAWLCVTFAS